MTSQLEHALDYAKHGIPVFPIVPRDKNPLVGGGFHSATVDKQTIVTWWTRWERANIGIPTGTPSGFWVLDVDGKAGMLSLKHLEAQHGMLPETRTARTGSGGMHLLFRHVPGLRNKVAFAAGLDTRADGGYIVAPPSVHESGNSYEWLSDAPLAHAPDWLIREVSRRPVNGSQSQPPPATLESGRRNAGLASIAGRLRRAGLDEPAIVAALLEHNQASCVPPLEDSEVRAIAGSISRYERGQVPYAHEPSTGVMNGQPVDLSTALPPVRRVRAAEFLSRERPPRLAIIHPWLREKSLTLIHAPRGVGKSWFALTVAMIAAGGHPAPPFGWSLGEPSEVLYVDAEMAADEFAKRMRALCPEEFAPENLHIVSADDSDGPIPSLATPEGRELMEELCRGMHLIVLDNVSTLWSGVGDQNAAESWDVAQVWLLDMRRRGHSIILVDHSGKTPGRGARGTSRKEDIMDVCIELTRPEDAESEDGAHFTCKFTKSRGLYGAVIRDRRYRLKTTHPTHSWEISDGVNSLMEDVAMLLAERGTIRSIARELSIPPTTAHRLVSKCRKMQMGT